MRDLDVIKIGGSVIFGGEDGIRADVLGGIFEQLAKQPKKIIVTGCGESLHNFVYRHDLTDNPKPYNYKERKIATKIAENKILENLSELEKISEPHIKTKTFLPSDLFEKESRGRKDNHEIIEFWKEILDHTLDLGKTPLISGGMVSDRNLGYSAISSDTIAAYLGEKYDAGRVILLADVDGVYDSGSKLLKKVDSSDYADFEGGMGDKLRRVGFAAKNRSVYIANGNKIENLGRIITEDSGIFTRVL